MGVIEFLIVMLMLGLMFLVAIPLGLLALVLSPHVQRSLGRLARSIAPVAALGLAAAVLVGFLLNRQTYREAQHRVQARQQLMDTAQGLKRDAILTAEAEKLALAEQLRSSSGPASSPAEALAASDPAVVEERAAPQLGADPLTPTAITAFVGESSAGQVVQQLPDWVSEAPQRDADQDRETFVLRSSRFSSIEEAEAELLQQLRQPLGNYLAQGGLTLDMSQLALNDVRQAHLRTQRVVETFELPLKSSVEPVYRVSWQVRLRPVVRDTLGADYRLASQQGRLWDLGIGVGLATLLFGVWAAYFQIDDSTQGRYRGRLKLAAAAASIGGLAGIFLA
ncbi:MAG: hypothetical protein ACK5Q5_04690 [Planctomycetaceae bacterium]